MEQQFVGLDVSQAETAVCVIDASGVAVWQGKCASTPEAIGATLTRRAPRVARIALETGPMSAWHWRTLSAMSLPVVCIDARHARASLAEQIARLDKLLLTQTRKEPACRRLMTVPGIGAITAAAFVATIDDPGRFRHSASVGAYLGLTPRRYQSGTMDVSGHISKAGDGLLRSYLFEAATTLLTRVQRWSALKAWGVRLAKRLAEESEGRTGQEVVRRALSHVGGWH
jgi:transposase